MLAFYTPVSPETPRHRENHSRKKPYAANGSFRFRESPVPAVVHPATLDFYPVWFSLRLSVSGVKILEAHLHTELQGAWRAQAEHAAAQPGPIGSLMIGSAVHRSRRGVSEGVQHRRQRIVRGIKVREVENIVESHIGRDHETLTEFVIPTQGHIGGTQPGQSLLAHGRRIHQSLRPLQLDQLRGVENL